MAAPFNNVRSKLSRAICAYLVTIPNCGTAADILPHTSNAARTYPVTTIRPGAFSPSVQYSGNLTGVVRVGLRASSASDPGDNTQAARLALDARLAATHDALMKSSTNGQDLDATALAITTAGRALAVSDAANNADMADFTCPQWIEGGIGDGEPDVEGAAWEEVLTFTAVACGANTD